MLELEKYINEFYDDLNSTDSHRYKSWEHCFIFFKENYKNILENEELIELATLHLSFYLASWGMYRGSTFLLRHDFKINIPIVKLICNKEYHCLFEPYNKEKLFELKDKIKEEYKKSSNNASDTLISKILLGTSGSTIAYDRYVKKSLQSLNYCQTFNEKSYQEIIEFIKKKDNKDILNRVKKDKKFESYSKMKLLDMSLFKKGAELEKQEAELKKSTKKKVESQVKSKM